VISCHSVAEGQAGTGLVAVAALLQAQVHQPTVEPEPFVAAVHFIPIQKMFYSDVNNLF